MTDWERVRKLRSKGASWNEVAEDKNVGFDPPRGTDPGRALKTLYFRNKSRGQSKGMTKETMSKKGKTLPHAFATPKRIALIAIAVAFILIIAYVVISPPGNGGQPTGWVGRQAPNFSLPMANGQGTFTLSSEKGQKNVLLFFNEGLSCSPCLSQMQQLDTDAGQFQPYNVMIVSITGDSQSDMTNWAQNSNITHTDVLADPTLEVCNLYDTTGAAVSMMPGTAPGHTFILVNMTGVVVWRADYGPSDMSVPESEILQNVQNALRG